MENQKKLNLLDATFLVAGSMIGSGIFIVASDMARNLGSPWWLIACWVISGLFTIFAALSYGELAGMLPKAGGQYVYLSEAFGKPMAFLYGWSVFTVIQTGVIAAVAVAFAKYAGLFFPMLDEQRICLDVGVFKLKNAQLAAVALILVLTWINTGGLGFGNLIQRVFTSAKLLALFILIAGGLYFGSKLGFFNQNANIAWEAGKWTFENKSWNFSPISGWALVSGLGVAMIGSLFSSDAWNNVTFIAGDIDKPHRNIPLALFLGTFIVTVLYVLCNVAYLYLLPLQGISDGPDVISRGMVFAANDRVGTAAMYGILGEASVFLMAALIMISTFGCNNGLILAGSRLFHAMAKDGLFFKSAARINAKGVPSHALWIQAIWASVLCLSGSYSELLNYTVFASVLFYGITIIALFKLRKSQPNWPRPYKAWGYPLVPALYVVFALFICLNLLWTSPFSSVMGLLIVLSGYPVFAWMSKRNLQ